MIYHDIPQNSDEWFALRTGKFTASTFKDLFMGKTTQGYQDAIYKVAFERLTNESPESFTNEWMQRGTELEPEARAWYEFERDVKVLNGGFFEYNDWIGASPDGLVGEDGLLEIKCPKYSTLMNYLMNKELPKNYYYQVHGQMLVSDRQWCDFIAYHPKLPRLVLRVERNKEIDNEILDKLFEGIKQVEKIINKLKG